MKIIISHVVSIKTVSKACGQHKEGCNPLFNVTDSRALKLNSSILLKELELEVHETSLGRRDLVEAIFLKIDDLHSVHGYIVFLTPSSSHVLLELLMRPLKNSLRGKVSKLELHFDSPETVNKLPESFVHILTKFSGNIRLILKWRLERKAIPSRLVNLLLTWKAKYEFSSKTLIKIEIVVEEILSNGYNREFEVFRIEKFKNFPLKIYSTNLALYQEFKKWNPIINEISKKIMHHALLTCYPPSSTTLVKISLEETKTLCTIMNLKNVTLFVTTGSSKLLFPCLQHQSNAFVHSIFSEFDITCFGLRLMVNNIVRTKRQIKVHKQIISLERSDSFFSLCLYLEDLGSVVHGASELAKNPIIELNGLVY